MRQTALTGLAAGLAAMLAACQPKPTPEAKAPAITRSAEPELIVRLGKEGAAARRLVENVAARCWLDGVVGGAQLIVDRQTGKVIIVDDTSDLLIADFLHPKDGRSRLRLTGPAITDPDKARRLVGTLDRADKTGRTSCPRAST